MILSEEELPSDVESLKALVFDLSRRLQNAQHTIEAERRISTNALRQSEYFRNRLAETVRSFRLESAKMRNSELRASIHMESQKYEENKLKGVTLHEQLRVMELDYVISGNKHIVPMKLQRMRQQAKQLEQQQTSQKILLQQLNEKAQLQDAIATAVQHGDTTQCLSLLRQGADPNSLDPAGCLPLHYACVYGQYEIAQLLLKWGSDYSSYLSGNVPLALAAEHGHINVIRLLLDYGAGLEEKGKNMITPLIAALQAGQYNTVEFLLQQGANVNNVDGAENTALHHATRIINTDDPTIAERVIDLLLEYGADLMKRNRKEETPHEMALYEKHRGTADVLRVRLIALDPLAAFEGFAAAPIDPPPTAAAAGIALPSVKAPAGSKGGSKNSTTAGQHQLGISKSTTVPSLQQLQRQKHTTAEVSISQAIIKSDKRRVQEEAKAAVESKVETDVHSVASSVTYEA